MFKNDRYLTKGVTNVIPYYLQVAMWLAIDAMEVSKKDYLQVFRLSKIVDDGIEKQCLVHTQEQPNYKLEHIIPSSDTKIVTEKIFVIDDGQQTVMLLAEEY